MSPGFYQNPGYAPPHGKSGDDGAKGEDGHDYCRDIGNRAQLNATEHRAAAWTIGGFALGATAASFGVAASDQPSDTAGKNRYKVAVSTLPLAAALLAYIAEGQFSLASNSDALASATDSAMNKSNADAAKTCNEALAGWQNGHNAEAFVAALKTVESDGGAPAPAPAAPAPAAPAPAPAAAH
jgi:hypothetical protein